MERELERVREREPEPQDPYEFNLRWKMEKTRKMREGKVVIKAKEVPLIQTRHSFGRWYLGPAQWDQVGAPGWIVKRSFLENIRRGKHTHTGGGVVFYILEGQGCTVNNDGRMDWGPGDVELLPITPFENVHQHFNLEPGRPCGWVSIRFWPFMEPLAYETRQVEDSPDWKGSRSEELFRPADFVPDAAKVRGYDISFEGPPATLLDDIFRRRNEWRERMRKAKQVIQEKDCPVERNRMGLYRWYIHPSFTDVACRHIFLWTQQIPPGSCSGRQKHQGGRIHFIIQGKGYSVLDGVRYDWEEEDLLILPIKVGGTIFQHFNADPDRPAKMAVAEPNWYDILGVDMACGLEQMEDSPDYP
ncbi:MAG: hypothetical protein HYY45_09620 [Deltaproteobacteria bacterium]|nr:hypothetical protein [Deltaproteobacteria bacterium]